MTSLYAANVRLTVQVYDDDYGPGLPPLSTINIETVLGVTDADNPVNILAQLTVQGVFDLARFGPIAEDERLRGQYYRVSGQVITPGNSPVDLNAHTMYMDATGSFAFDLV